MKKVICFSLILLLIFNSSVCIFASENADREYEKNLAKEKMGVDVYGGIVDNDDEYIKKLLELIDAPETEECAGLFEKNGTKGVHPRVLATAEDFERIKISTETDEFASFLCLKLTEYADSLIKTLPVHENTMSSRLAFSREIVDRMVLFGMLYRLSGDEKYYEYAKSQIQIAMEESATWTDSVLETAELTAGLSIAYDWFFDAMDSAFKDSLKSWIATKMRKISTNYYPVPQGFARQVNNWNAVCNGSYGLAAISVFDEEPELSAQVLSGAAKAIPISVDQFGPDGGFPEGPGYWAYQIQYIIYFLSSLDSALKNDFGISELNGIKNTANHILHMHGPTHNGFNYSDAGEGVPQTQYLYWFTKKYGDGRYAAYADMVNPAGTDYSSWEFKSTDAFILLWYEGAVEASFDDLSTGGVYHGGNPVATLRTRWNDPEATFVGFKGGDGSLSHANLDIGTFVIDSLGVRWVNDLGREDNYSLPGYFDYENGGRWNYYVNRAEGHNTIVINPSPAADQNTTVKCDITEFENEPSRRYGIIDMTPAYFQHSSSAKRGVALCGESVVVRDEIALKNQSDVLWGINTKAQIELSNDKKTATLSIDNKKMKVSIISPENAAFDTMAAESLYVPTVPGSRSLAAYRRLIMRGIYSGNVDIAVQFTAYNSGEPEPWTFDKVYPLSEWSDGRIYESNGIVKNIKVNGTDMEGFVSSKLGYVLNVDENGEIPVIEPEFDRINSRITMTKAENIGDTVKIQAVSKDPRVGSMEYVFTIEEKKTFGKPEGMDKVEIKNITSSNSGHEPAFDGRLDTRWVCEGSQWMLIDFGEKMPVDMVSMSFYKGVQRVTYFEIYVSDDGENFTKAFSGGASGASNDYENFKLSNANARYMKIVCNGSSTGIWASINEIEMYNFK